MYTFDSSYTLQTFLRSYVYEHLLMYPVAIFLIALGSIIFVRVKGNSFVQHWLIKSQEYYTRIDYRFLVGTIIFAIVSVCILLLVGVLYNTTLSNKLDNTVDAAFGVILDTSDNLNAINASLVELQNTLAGGLNGSVSINSSQTAITADLDEVITQFEALNESLNSFSLYIDSLAVLSEESRVIIVSLKGYSQLTNVPAVDEVSMIDSADLANRFDEAQDSIADAIAQLNSIKSDVSNINAQLSSYDFSSTISDITSARSSIEDFREDLLKNYEKKDDVDSKIDYYDSIRIAIIVLTYLVPLLVVVAGLLGSQIRSSPVMRAWYHMLFVGGALCGIFAAIYTAPSILIEDVCYDFDTSFFVGVRSAYPDYLTLSWYEDLVTYYPIATKCEGNGTFLDLIDIPSDILDILENPGSLIVSAIGNYSGLVSDALSTLDSGMEYINSFNSTLLLDATLTLNKLSDIQQQLTNLTAFGFSMSEYNSALQDINTQTQSIPATYPNGTYVTLSLYYIAANISLLQLDDDPYVYTPQSYRDDLNTSLTTFLALDAALNEVLSLTSAISSNVTVLINNVEALESSQSTVNAYLADANARADDIHASANAIDAEVYNLTYVILPEYLNATQLWDLIESTTSCNVTSVVYNKVVTFLCESTKAACDAFISTHAICILILLIASLDASYAWTVFTFPYKPFYNPPTVLIDDQVLLSSSSSTTFMTRAASRKRLESRKYVIVDD